MPCARTPIVEGLRCILRWGKRVGAPKVQLLFLQNLRERIFKLKTIFNPTSIWFLSTLRSIRSRGGAVLTERDSESIRLNLFGIRAGCATRIPLTGVREREEKKKKQKGSPTCSRLHGARVERNYRYRHRGIIANYITYRVHIEYYVD